MRQQIFKSGFYEKLKFLIIPMMLLTLGVGQMWAGDTYKVTFKKDMGSGDYNTGTTYYTMTQCPDNSDIYYYSAVLEKGSYGFFLQKNSTNYFKADATATDYNKVELFDYGSTNYGGSPHRVTYSAASAGTYVFTYDAKNKKVYVSPASSQSVEMYYDVASGHDDWWDLSNHVTLTEIGSTGEYYTDLDLTGACKYYMYIRIPADGNYFKGTSELTVGGTVTLYLYDGNNGDKVNFTPSTTGKYRFTWNHGAKTVKYERAYLLTYNGNSETGGATPSNVYYTNGQEVTVASRNTLAKTNYSFMGWNTANDGSGTNYAESTGTFNMGSADKTLYAKWNQSVTLSANTAANHGGGSNGSATATWNAGALSDISHATGSTGYKKTGYYTAATGGTKVLNANGTFAGNNISGYITSSKWSRTSTTTLTAQWEAETYTITLNKHNGGANGSITVTFDATTNLTGTVAADPGKTGYTFGGYWTGENGTGTQVIAADGTVVSNANDGGSNTYTSSGAWKYPNSITLHAKWTENNYTVTVQAGAGGSVASGSVTGHIDTKVTLPTATPNLGYYFTGWTRVSGSTVTWTNQNSTNTAQVNGLTSAVTVQANFASIWALVGSMNSWNAATNPLGNYSTVSTKNYGYVDVTLNANTQYSFKLKNVQTSAMYKPTSSNTEITYANKATAQGMNNTDGGDPNQTIMTAGKGTYRFTWNMTDKSIEVTYPVSYTVTYGYGTGGSEVTASVSGGAGALTSGKYATGGTDITFTQTPAIGYTFKGWYTTIDGNTAVSTMAVDDNVLNGIDADKTVYAQYTANTYAVTFDYSTNGGSKTSGNDQNNATYNQNTISVPTVKKDGYCFNGWYTAAEGGVLVVDKDGNLQENVVVSATTWTDGTGKWKKTGTATVYAQFSIPEVTLTKSGKGLISSMPGYDTVVINYTFSGCVPTGNYNVADTVGYAVNHAHLAPQPTIKYGTGAGVGHDTIIMPVEDGTNYYEVVATLRTGSVRGEGTVIRRDTIRADVESSYLVKIRYQVDGIDIQPEKGWYLYPSFRAIGVNIPKTLNGYELDSCRYGVGVTLDHEADELEGYTTKYCYTENASTITAVYKPKANTVYFMDAFGKYWYSTKMKIYDYGTSNSYWVSNVYGAKSEGLTGDTVEVAKSGTPEIMMASIDASTTNFAITNKKMDNYNRFHGSSTNNEWARVVYRTDFNAATPMFVPVSTNPDGDFYVLNQMDDGAAHYYRGFWVKFSPNVDSTGYILKVYDGTGSDKLIQSIPLRLTQTGEGNSYELTATMDLEGGKTYGFQFTKATGASTVATYGTSTTLTSASPSAVGLTSGGSKCGLTTTSAGDYTFHVYCANFGTIAANSATAAQVQGQWGVKVDYATQANDYRVYYKDNSMTEPIVSQTIRNRANGQDTVSFFVRKDKTNRVLKFQKFNGSSSAWEDVIGGAIDTTGFFRKDSIYVIYLQQNEGATTISVTGHDYYDGDIYIRTDCVDDYKWDYKQSLENHKMSETDYGMAPIQPFKFSHYYVHWCTANSNVKYVIANKYAPCLTDTVITDTWVTDGGGKLGEKGANIRFMYNKSTNATQRAYLYGSEENDANYLKLREYPDNNKMQDTNGATINDIKFTDEKNWIYTADIKAVPGLKAQLTADYLGQRQYFLGNADSGEEILGGTTGEPQSIDLTYDFKTNRLVCAWRPSGDSIKAEIPINADVLIIRKAQGNAEQLRFNNDGKLSSVKYAYGVIQFDYNDMYHSMYRWDYWSYMHCMYYISFPYDVLVSDIMGVGQLGVDWRLQRYNGAKRAKDGWYAGDGVTTFWEDLQPGDTLHAYEGYSLLLNRNRFNGTVGNIWDNKVAGSSVYLYFPSATATTGIVQNKEVVVTVPAHLCTIDKPFQQDPSKNHKIVDSHWNMIGTPLFEDKTASTIVDPAPIDGQTLHYVYTWNYFSNTLGIAAVLNTEFEFKTMYGYMVQYAGNITFSGSAVNKIVAAERSDEKKNYRLNLEISKDDQFVGRTYVELNENAVDSFALNEDVCMLKNGVIADLYTFSGAYEAGANVMTIGNHIIPVGIDVKTAGTFTFSMPDNFDGTVTLLDTYTQTRTNLSLDVYEVYLEQGTIEGRFFIELDVQQTITSLENVDGNNGINDGAVHKFIQNDQMYILKNGVIYDARGARVQ